MSFNDFMHPRNKYKNQPPDFKELAELYPHFKKHVNYSKSGKAFVNFRNPEVVRSLSLCLFDKDFQLKIELPQDRLAPTIPLRLNYILWVQDLLSCTTNIICPTILDIGCGSSCVYPLLGCRLFTDWKFIASETNDKNVLFASKNIERNNFNERIEIKHVSADAKLLADHHFDLCMCNPPFFTSNDELLTSSDRPSANSSCSGHTTELIGGDFLYAQRIFEESLLLKLDRTWFTVMLGKKSSFLKVKALLRHNEVKTVCCTDFCQGRTMRWGVAWSYRVIDISSVPNPKPKTDKKKKSLTFTSKYPLISETMQATKVLLQSLAVSFIQNDLLFSISANIDLVLPNRKERRKTKQTTKILNDSPPKKKLKTSDNLCDGFKCELEIKRVSFAPSVLELRALTEGCPDLLNRFYSYLRHKL